jgi:hypothetical protein
VFAADASVEKPRTNKQKHLDALGYERMTDKSADESGRF